MAQTQLPLKHYDYAVWKNWSPNSGVDATSIQNTYDTYVAAFIALAQANGAIPIIITSIPCNGIASLTADQARQHINAQTLALSDPPNVLVADWDSALTTAPVAPPSWPQIPAMYTPDGTHPNAAGQAILAPILGTLIPGAIR